VLNLADSFPQQFPQWSNQKGLVVAAITAFLFFGSVLGHELAHSLVARRFQMSVSSITLFLLGGVANLRKEPPSAKAEFFMAAAGPATSVVIGVAALGVAFLIDPRAALPNVEAVQAVAVYLGTVNLYLAGFNMIPGFPLDGGRVLRSIIWAVSGDRTRATTIAGRGGQLVALAFGAFVLYEVVILHDAQGLWLGLIAYFLWSAATSSLQQERIASVVGGAKVGPLMTTDFKSTPPGVMVGQVIRDFVLPMNLRAIPVVSGGQFIGLVTIGDLRIDLARREVRRGARSISLRPREFDLLVCLIGRAGRVVDRRELLREVWGYDESVVSRTVDTHLAELRRKLAHRPEATGCIETVFGIGYRLRL